MVNYCKCCDVQMFFFVYEIIEAVSSIAKRWPKNKDLVNSLLNKDVILKCNSSNYQAFGFYNM